MNQRMLEALARERLAEVRRIAGDYECRSPAAAVPAGAALARTGTARRRRGGGLYAGASTRPARDVTNSLRTRAGWRLVDLGLRLAVRPDSRRAASPGAAGS